MIPVAELLSFADELADAARAAILPFFRAAHVIDNKKPAGFDPVTEADHASERAIRALIAKRFPDHGVLGEEFGHAPTRDGYTWIVDPIDGTRGFIAGLPLWGVLIALAKDGAPIIGVIDQPYLGERFRGWPGGADLVTHEGVRSLRVRACAGLNEARLATTDPTLFSGEDAARFARVRDRARLTRYGCDCYAYAMLALGGLDCVIENGLSPWDVAALAPVIEGAGGALTDWNGASLWREDWFAAKGKLNALATGDARVRTEALDALR